MLTTAGEPLDHRTWPIVDDGCARLFKSPAVVGQRPPLGGGHEHSAQGLSEGIENQLDCHAPPLRLEQCIEQCLSVAVVFEVKGRQVEESAGLPDVPQAMRPFLCPVPQRRKRDGGGHQRR